MVYMGAVGLKGFSTLVVIVRKIDYASDVKTI